MTKYVDHLLMPGQTIHAVISKYNSYPKKEIMRQALDQFYEINGNRTFRPGEKVKVPVLIGG